MLFLFIIKSVLLVAIIFIQSKYLILIDNPHGQTHKSEYNKNTPLSGGIFLFIGISISLFFEDSSNNSLILIAFLFVILLLGIFSDLRADFSPKLRLILQFIFVFFFIFLIDLKINKTGVFFLDAYIDNKFFNLFFTSFCITILINGSNFCDGVNCNIIGYYLVILLSLFYSKLPTPNNLPSIEILLMIFFIFYLANLFQKSFLGDNGTYFIATFMAIFVISFININSSISPLLALNLLWYPAFENLFTIIRRLHINKKIYVADKQHFHTLLMKKFLNPKINITVSNSITGAVLNLLMSIGIFISINYYNNSKVLITILFCNIISYILIYFLFLFKNPEIKSL